MRAIRLVISVLSAVSLLLAAEAVRADALPLGLGIADVSVEEGVTLEFFADLDAAQPLLRFAIVDSSAIQSLVLSPVPPTWFRIEGLWLDYSILTFRVTSETENCLEVIVDGGDGSALWLRRSPAVRFLPWPVFLEESVTWIERLDRVTNPLRAAPSTAATVLLYEDRDCFEVGEVRGEWIRIQVSVLCDHDGEGGVRVPDAWIRWRDEEHLLIAYGLTC